MEADEFVRRVDAGRRSREYGRDRAHRRRRRRGDRRTRCSGVVGAAGYATARYSTRLERWLPDADLGLGTNDRGSLASLRQWFWGSASATPP